MATLPSAFSRLNPPSTPSRVEFGKPVASIARTRQFPNHQPAPRVATLFTLPKEPEDARITGGTRSLDRRLLALNLSGPPLVPERIAS
jgi:hypothetical protein